jgi:SpoVK/Ycf46/Vps4 family AAA+-type ATPase
MGATEAFAHAPPPQIYASVVSTLLALMDGLSSRGQVMVIGATNRPDAIDPALRRPGRFDRELYFGLPTADDRRAILHVHTRRWAVPPSPALLTAVAHATPGFAGADLAALCTAVALAAFDRTHPHALDDPRALRQLLSAPLPCAATAAAAAAAAGAEGEHYPAHDSHARPPPGGVPGRPDCPSRGAPPASAKRTSTWWVRVAACASR